MLPDMLRHGLRVTRSRGSTAARLFALLLIGGCANPAPVPLSPAKLLSELRELEVGAALRDLGLPTSTTPSTALSVEDGVAIALRHNPALRAARSRVGIAQAKIVIAGLFPDPQLSADLSDLGVLRSEFDDGGDVGFVDCGGHGGGLRLVVSREGFGDVFSKRCLCFGQPVDAVFYLCRSLHSFGLCVDFQRNGIRDGNGQLCIPLCDDSSHVALNHV